MEPVFMILGQCAGAAAALALGDGGVVQNVSYGSLEKKLRQEAQVIEEPRAFDELEIVGQHYLEELVPFPSSASHIVKKDAA